MKATAIKDIIQKGGIPYEKLCVSAVLSRLAYKPFQEMRIDSVKYLKDDTKLRTLVEQALPKSLDDLKFICGNELGEFHDTQVYTWLRDNRLYVVFRGTDSKEDMLANIDLRQRCAGFGKGILVHNGFRKQFEIAEENLTKMIVENRTEIKEIYFLGHSLGMACATIASLFYAQYLKENNPNELPIPALHCHSFGGPRVGNKKFTEFYVKQEELFKNTWRVIDYRDPVPKVPISAHYHHVPCKTLYLKDNGKIKVKTDDYHWFVRPFTLFRSSSLVECFTPHDIVSYIEKLRDIVFEMRENESGDKTVDEK